MRGVFHLDLKFAFILRRSGRVNQIKLLTTYATNIFLAAASSAYFALFNLTLLFLEFNVRCGLLDPALLYFSVVVCRVSILLLPSSVQLLLGGFPYVWLVPFPVAGREPAVRFIGFIFHFKFKLIHFKFNFEYYHGVLGFWGLWHEEVTRFWSLVSNST